MIYIKKFILGKDEKEINAIINENDKTIKIKKSDYDVIISVGYVINYRCLELYDDRGRKILAYSLSFLKETKKYNLYSFEFLIIGTHKKEALKNIKKITIKYHTITEKKIFYENAPVIKDRIENGIDIILTNNKLILDNIYLNEDYIQSNILINVFEIIAIIYGSFPIIESLEIIVDESKILKIPSAHGYLNTAKSNAIINNPIVSFSNIINFSEIYNNYKELKCKLNMLPIQGFFYSQSESQVYSNYQLVNLLQSLDGFCEIIYKDEIKKLKNTSEVVKMQKDIIKESKQALKRFIKEDFKNKISEFFDMYIDNNLEKDLKNYYIRYLENYLKEHKNKWDYSSNIYSEICDSLSYANSKNSFSDIIKYLFNKSYSIDIFSEELEKEDIKENFIKKTVNERHKLSHMTIENDNKYFSGEEINKAFAKYSLLFRNIILENLKIKVG